MKTKTKTKTNRNWLWGILLLFVAVAIIANQLGWLPRMGFMTMVAAILAVALLITCLTQRSISTLPFVIAMAYIVLRNFELVPHVQLWAILVVAGLVSAGLGFLFPQKTPKGKVVVGAFVSDSDDDDEDWDDLDDEAASARRRERAAMGGLDNNPEINVNFGGVNRYLHADRLETVRLNCNFGGIEAYFDQVDLAPGGATVYIDCKFGGIDMFVPRHWQVDNQVNCFLGALDVGKRKAPLLQDSPILTIVGNVMFGGVDITYI